MNLFILFSIALVPLIPRDSQKWVVDKNSTVNISGRTNVNRFSCNLGEYAGPDTIVIGKPGCKDPKGVALSGMIRLPIEGFDCKNSMMTGEFRRALHYREYRELCIAFVSLDQMPEPCAVVQSLKGVVEITLSGVTRSFEINYNTVMTEAGTVVLEGSRTVGFSDFGLTPPQKLGGLVKVNNAIDVHFALCLRRLS